MIRSFILFMVLTCVALSFASSAIASGNTADSHKYWIFLHDKKGSEFNPHTYFDKKAIDRRKKLGLNLYDSSDFPVSEIYLKHLTPLLDSVKVVSRWMNVVVAYANTSNIEAIRELSFVDSAVSALPLKKQISGGEALSGGFEMSKSQRDLVKAQISRMQGEVFQSNKLTGKGIRIAVFDVGFKSYKTNPAFTHLRERNQIKSTWDFVKKRTNVDAGGSHGTNVLSCIAGRDNKQIMGLAEDAEFLLARTETWTEFFSEEENWLAAAEWADKHGADVINSSLGYTYHRYFRYNMDGQTAFVTRAANMAAHKGILVVNSNGNEGSNSWKNMGAPADADSVLSIGGIHPKTGIHTSFSSFGPTWDKRMKPNVSAYGHVVASGPKGYHKTQGTSFSSPLVAGFVACAWQSDTSLTNMEIFELVERSADLYPYFDYAHGYGVPQASYFINTEDEETDQSIKFVEDEYYVRIRFLDSMEHQTKVSAKLRETQDVVGNSVSLPPYLYYSIEHGTGYLVKYLVIGSGSIEKAGVQADPYSIDTSEFEKPFTVRAYYKGTYIETTVEE